MALSPLLLAPLRLPAKALDGLPGLAPSTNPDPYVTGLRGGAPPGPRHQVIYLIRVHSAFVELPQEAFRQVPLRGS